MFSSRILPWFSSLSKRPSAITQRGLSLALRSRLLTLAVLSLSAPALFAQYSTTKFIDPNTFPTDTTSGFGLGATLVTDGTYTALSTYDAVWSKTVAGGTPQKLFSIGANLPSSTTPASYIYGAVEISKGTIVFYANGAISGGGTLYGIYSVPADGSGSAVRVADSTQVAQGVWYEDVDVYGRYGLFSVANGTVVFGIGGSLYSAGIDGSNLTTLWQTNSSFPGCSTNGEYSGVFQVGGANAPATDGTNYAFEGSSDLSFVGLYVGPLTTIDTCNDLITSGTCNICGPISTLPGQPQNGTAFYFQNLIQIDGDYVYFMADAGGGVSSSVDYYGLFKVPLAGGPANAVVTNISHIPALLNANGTYDEPYFYGYAVNNGKVIFYAVDNTQGGAAEPAFYMVQGSSYVPIFTNQTSVDNQCMGNMTDSTLAGLVSPELTADGHLYFSGEYITSGPDLNGSCAYSFLRFSPYAYYVVDTNHPLIPAQTTITMTPAPASVTTTTPVTLNIAVGPTAGTTNPGGLIPTGTVWVYYTSPQIYGVQGGTALTLDDTGKASISLGDLEDIQYNFTVSYGGDINFTQSGSNAIALDLRPPAPAAITAPTPASTLTSPKATFTWSTGVHVTNYQLTLGTTGVGSSDVYNSGSTTATSVNVTNIPTTGATLYASLSSEIAGTWSTTNYTYTEASPAAPATMTSPTPGSKLLFSSATFTWTAGSQVTQYDLHVGTTGAGSSNIFGGSVTGQTKTITGIPTTAGTLNVRLYSYINGAWQYNDYTYTEASPAAPATMTTPVAGSTLTGSTVVFSWTTGSQVTEYDLHIGTTGVGSSNLYADTVTGQSQSVTGIPTTGGTLYVRLYSLIAGAWQSSDYTYTEYTAPVLAAITSPAPGSTLAGTSATFSWTTGTLVTQYDLHVGTTGAGSSNIFGGTVTGQTRTITGIPTAGATLYVRLYSFISGAWQYSDYTYKEYSVPAPATITTPTPGSTLTGSTATFTWTTGTEVTQYDLHVGTTGAGSTNIFGGTVTGQTQTITGIPTTGATLNVRLYSFINGAWQYNDYTYTEQ